MSRHNIWIRRADEPLWLAIPQKERSAFISDALNGRLKTDPVVEPADDYIRYCVHGNVAKRCPVCV